MDFIRKKNTNSAWAASAITGNGQEWAAMPGSYYKMGSDWGDQDDHLTIEVEKMGREVGSILLAVPYLKKY